MSEFHKAFYVNCLKHDIEYPKWRKCPKCTAIINYSEEEMLKLIRQAFQAARTKRKVEMKVGYDYITGLKRKYLYPDAKEWFESFKKK